MVYNLLKRGKHIYPWSQVQTGNSKTARVITYIVDPIRAIKRPTWNACQKIYTGQLLIAVISDAKENEGKITHHCGIAQYIIPFEARVGVKKVRPYTPYSQRGWHPGQARKSIYFFILLLFYTRQYYAVKTKAGSYFSTKNDFGMELKTKKENNY